jgi:hypothetical protein
MSEEGRDQAQEEARRVLSPVRLAVLLLLGALFLVVGGSRADAAEAEPAPDQGPHLVAGTFGALGADEGLTAVGATVDGLVDSVLTATESVTDPVVEPVVQPVVGPVVEPVVAPLRPVVERVVTPPATVPAPELLAPAPAATAGPDRAGSSVRPATTEGGTDTAAALAAPAAEDGPASMAASGRASGAPVHGSPVSRSTASSSDGGAGAPVPYAVLLTAFAAVLLFAGGVAPRRVAPPLAPTFLPPVFPG